MLIPQLLDVSVINVPGMCQPAIDEDGPLLQPFEQIFDVSCVLLDGRVVVALLLFGSSSIGVCSHFQVEKL